MDTQIQQFDLYINGEIVPSKSSKSFDAINPSNSQVIAQIADASFEDMHLAVNSARKSFVEGGWKSFSFAQRGVYLKQIAKLIRKNAKELAQLECLDTGKTIKHTTFIDIPSSAEVFEYYSTIDSQMDDIVNKIEAPVQSITKREPVGVVGSIIPYNYPLLFAAWKICPAIMVGNSIVLKPSKDACLSIMKLAQIIQESGLPAGVVNIVPTSSDEVANDLVTNENVNMISFTGGSKTGQQIMRDASTQTKKLVLELGGKSPNIVFADCNLEAALGATMSSIFLNQGQMCTACSRLLLDEKIYDEFMQKLVAKTKQLKIGDPSSNATEFGPMTNQKHRDNILKAIEEAIREGAQLECGGKVPEGEAYSKGSYMEPTILSKVKPQMNIVKNEQFGPVLTVMKFTTEEEAIEMANQSQYGLAASVWSKDKEKTNRVSQRLDCGTVWINTYGGFYPQVSFSGRKASGFGSELGNEGLLEYTKTKHVCIDKTPGEMPLVASWF